MKRFIFSVLLVSVVGITAQAQSTCFGIDCPDEGGNGSANGGAYTPPGSTYVGNPSYDLNLDGGMSFDSCVSTCRRTFEAESSACINRYIGLNPDFTDYEDVTRCLNAAAGRRDQCLSPMAECDPGPIPQP